MSNSAIFASFLCTQIACLYVAEKDLKSPICCRIGSALELIINAKYSRVRQKVRQFAVDTHLSVSLGFTC